MIRMRSKCFFFIGCVICLVVIGSAQSVIAEVSAEEAAKLKSVLTPMGSERAGNQDGTIPEWKAGIATVPADWEVFYEYFPDEKPLFSINAKNVDQYSNKLSNGIRTLLEKYPDSMRLDVYPTHRTFASSEWVYENTFKNATRARAENNGESIAGAYGGFPFPIPKTGKEIMWNHTLGWGSETSVRHAKSYLITPDGVKTMVSDGIDWIERPYYYTEGSVETYNGVTEYSMHVQLGPANMVGQNSLLLGYSNDPDYRGRIYQYLSGQRRVKCLPNIEFDTPNTLTSGVTFFDEATQFGGRMCLFDWKIVGKKEMYIPYNTSRFYRGKIDDVLQKHHLNPDYVRWELHRVWVVEAALLPGRRHMVPRKVFYLDEDTWQIMMQDGWDAQGKLWRSSLKLHFHEPKAFVNVTATDVNFDLRSNGWAIDTLYNEVDDPYAYGIPRKGAGYFTVAGLRSLGVR